MANRTFSGMWMALLNQITSDGSWTESRNGRALEVVGGHGSFDMGYPLLCRNFRKLYYRFAFGEAHWILTGDNKLSSIVNLNRHFARFSDDGEVLAGAYGPRWEDQRQYVLNCLIKSPDSRQAVVSFWTKNPIVSKDIPCSLTLQFLIRDDTLHAIYMMRSSDLWLGLPYDAFSFTMMATWMALALRNSGMKLRLGKMFYRAGSMHLYEADFEKVHAAKMTGDLLTYEESWPRLDLREFEDGLDLVNNLEMLRDKQKSAKWLGRTLYGS